MIVFFSLLSQYPFIAALERKISVRANREVLIQKGILLPDSPLILGKSCHSIIFIYIISNIVYNLTE